MAGLMSQPGLMSRWGVPLALPQFVSRTSGSSRPGALQSRAMPRGRGHRPSQQHAGAWFSHSGVWQSQPESPTSSALKQVQDSEAAQGTEDRLPLAYRAQEQRAVNKNFPFSSHDNRHCLQNVGEYFDLGMGRRKVEPERQQQNSQNFFLWAHDSVPSSEDGLTIYQTSFVKDQNTKSPFCRRYPKHHSEKCGTHKPLPENEKNLQPNKSS
ncbi:testis-expressed protein 36 [Falco naumanni]|uniref:testis-expressed protein 36 n=1 Tax=Falco naumanni TaxID=148594 RepID=UPI001ADE61D8|nr:testis-expressed protein 36 [Falco naumanni]